MKKVNNKVSKRIVAIVLTAVAVFSLMGCKFEKNFTTTETHTYTDADGNTTTTTTTNHNGEITEETTSYTTDETMGYMEEDMEVEEISEEEAEVIVATLSFDNTTGVEIAELYFTDSEATDWGENLLGDEILTDEERLTFNNGFRYTKDCLYWDVKVVDKEGNALPFDHLDMSEAEDPENITIAITYDEEYDMYTATVL